MQNVKDFISEHKNFVIVGIVVLLFIIILSICRTMFLNSETESVENDEVAHYNTELTSQQKELYDQYSDDVLYVIAILSNNAWIDKTGLKNVEFKDKEFVERYNGEEKSSSYAICFLDKSDNSTASSRENCIECFNMTFLYSDDIYAQCKLEICHIDGSSNSEIQTINIYGQKMFSNSEIYTRAKRAQSIEIVNWNNEADSYIDNKKKELDDFINDYCYKFYPQVLTLTWNKKVVYDTENNTNLFTLTINAKTTKNVDLIYKKNEMSFSLEKSNS